MEAGEDAGEKAEAWKNKQPNPGDYEVIAPKEYTHRETLKGAVVVFMQKGDYGRIYEGENPIHATDGYTELDLTLKTVECAAEGGAVVAYIVKKRS